MKKDEKKSLLKAYMKKGLAKKFGKAVLKKLKMMSDKKKSEVSGTPNEPALMELVTQAMREVVIWKVEAGKVDEKDAALDDKKEVEWSANDGALCGKPTYVQHF